MLVSTTGVTSAQDVTAEAAPGSKYDGTANLAFSKDGRVLREARTAYPEAQGEFPHVRAISYDAKTGKIVYVLDLAADTWFFSATTDGRIAIISLDRDRTEAPVHLLRVDMETGHTQKLPSNWFDADNHNPYAAISGDGKLVSAFSENGWGEGSEVVTLYEWRRKKPVAKQSSGHSAGGIDWGEVTADGKIAFGNSRMGRGIIDPKTGRALTGYGPLSVRSPDGTWIVDFPNPSYGPETHEVPIRDGMNGQAVGKLDLQLTDEEAGSWWHGAFCGKSGRFIAAGYDKVLAFEIPSGKKLLSLPLGTWQGPKQDKATPIVACSPSGKRVAIRSGDRLTLHHLK